MKRNIYYLLPAVLAVIGIAVFAYIKTRPKTMTFYEDANQWIYECSRPIRGVDRGLKTGMGATTLSPVDMNEANKYCHYTGIE